MSSFSPLSSVESKLYVPSPPLDNFNRKSYKGRARRYRQRSNSDPIYNNDGRLSEPLHVTMSSERDDIPLNEDPEVLDVLMNRDAREYKQKCKGSHSIGLSRLLTVNSPTDSMNDETSSRLPDMDGSSRINLLNRVDGGRYNDVQHQPLFRQIASPDGSLMSSNSVYEPKGSTDNTLQGSLFHRQHEEKERDMDRGMDRDREREREEKDEDGYSLNRSWNRMNISQDGTILLRNSVGDISYESADDSSFTEMPLESSFSCSDSSPERENGVDLKKNKCHLSPGYWSNGDDLARRAFFGASATLGGNTLGIGRERVREKYSKMFNHVPESVMNTSNTSHESSNSSNEPNMSYASGGSYETEHEREQIEETG